MPTLLLLLLGLTVSTCVIAYWSDNLGKKLGKKRVSLWNLRPRQTATLLTMASSVCIMLGTMAALLTVNVSIRNALLYYDHEKAANTQLRTSNTQLSLENKTLGQQESGLRGRLKLLGTQVDEASLRAANAQHRLARTQKDLAGAEQRVDAAKRGEAQARRGEAGARRGERTARAGAAASQRARAAAVSQANAARFRLVAAQQQLGGVRQNLQVARTSLSQARARLSSAQTRLASAQVRLTSAQAKQRQAEAAQRQANRRTVEAYRRTVEAYRQTVASEKAGYAAKEVADAEVAKAQRQVGEAQVKVTALETQRRELEASLQTLQQETRQLQAEAQRYVALAASFTTGELLVQAGQVLADSTIAPSQNAAELERTIGTLLEAGRRSARALGASDVELLHSVDVGSGSVVLTPTQLVEGLHSYLGNFNGPVSLRLVTARAHAKSETIIISRLITIPVRTAFARGEALAEAQIDPSGGDAGIFNQLLALVNKGEAVARERGVSPVPTRENPYIYASGANERLFDALRSIEIGAKNGAKVPVRLVAADDLPTTEPLRVRFEVASRLVQSSSEP